MIAFDNAFKEQITEGYQVDPWFRNSANLRLLHFFALLQKHQTEI